MATRWVENVFLLVYVMQRQLANQLSCKLLKLFAAFRYRILRNLYLYVIRPSILLSVHVDVDSKKSRFTESSY